MEDAVPAFSKMLRDALGAHLRPEAHCFAQMFAPQGLMEFPYGLPGFDPIRGRDSLVRRLEAQGGRLEFVMMSDVVVHEVSDKRTFVVEFTGSAKNVKTGEISDQRLISVITIEDGFITHYKDYWNPLTLLGAMLGAEWLAGFLDEVRTNP